MVETLKEVAEQADEAIISMVRGFTLQCPFSHAII